MGVGKDDGRMMIDGPSIVLKRLVIVAVACICLFAGSLRAGTPPGPCAREVRWVRPGGEEILTAGTPLEVEVRSCQESGPNRVQFFADDTLVGTVAEPPYRIVWERANLSSRMTNLRAVAGWADGTIAAADLQVLAVPPFVTEERVEIVNVYVTVRNRHEEYISGLAREDFRILEDGAPQAITHFGVEDLALNVAFVLDASYSMTGRKLATARAALVNFVQSMSFPRDQAMIVEIHGAPVLRTDWTRDKATLLAGLDDLEARGNTALYDSILVAARALRDQDGRKVMVVLSDGMDINTDGEVNRPGSVYSLYQVLDYTKRAEVMVYCVGLGKRLDKLYDIFAQQPLAKILRTFAEDTGGRTFFAKRAEELHGAFGRVVDDLRHQYSLGYSSSNLDRDGAWRKIRVEVPGHEKQYRLNHRPGYYAPSS